MIHRIAIIAGLIAGFIVAVFFWRSPERRPVLAHEGHGKGESQGFDLNAPRNISPEAAALIGLETAEVDFGSVMSVLRVSGRVRAQPDRVHAISTRIGGWVESIRARVGDRVAKGDVLVEIVSREYLELCADLARTESDVDRLVVSAHRIHEWFRRQQSSRFASYVTLHSGLAAHAGQTSPFPPSRTGAGRQRAELCRGHDVSWMTSRERRRRRPRQNFDHICAVARSSTTAIRRPDTTTLAAIESNRTRSVCSRTPIGRSGSISRTRTRRAALSRL